MMTKFDRNFLFTSLFFIYPLILFLASPVRTMDLGLWTALGVQSIKAGHLVTVDTFSLLPTSKMIYPSWGLSLLYGSIFLMSGPWFIAFLRLFHLLLLLVFLAIVYKKYFYHLQNRWHVKNILCVLLFFYGGNILFVDRPSLVAMIPALLAFDIIHRSNKIDWSKLISLFFITLVWVNIHASALLVLIMLGYKLFVSVLLRQSNVRVNIDLKSYVLAIAVSLLALMINPFGWSIFPYAVETARLSHHRFFTEWLSPFYFEDFFHSALYFLWLLFFSWQLFKSIKNKQVDILISPYVILTFAGLVAIRDTVWTYFFIFTVFVGESKTSNIKAVDQSKHSQWVNSLVVLALVVSLLSLNPFHRSKALSSLDGDRFDLKSQLPEVEVEMILSSRNPGPIFDAQVSGYLMLTVPNKIFVDARNIIFSNQSLSEYDSVVSARGDWGQILDKYKFEFVLLDKRYASARLVEELSKSKDWKTLSSRRNFFLAQRVHL